MLNTLAMYDVRGIQDYIYRTPNVKDAIGASYIVEKIIDDALSAAIEEQRIKRDECCLVWEEGEKVLEYTPNDCIKIQVLYVGGGNAFVGFENQELYQCITAAMSRFVLKKTYSMQLASACVAMSDNYLDDYLKLNQAMTKVKQSMYPSKPMGAFPIMQVEKKSGFPIAGEVGKLVELQNGQTIYKKVDASAETKMKVEAEQKLRERVESGVKVFDNYITEKGADSNIAVVHIDGNNMGLRIRSLTEGITNYTDAVNKMRHISHNINHSYKRVFDEMQQHFNDLRVAEKDRYFVLKILVAGDDITYICNANIALETVRWYCEKIAEYTMWKCGTEPTMEERKAYGFSVCAGISVIKSHFPFKIAYDVAEACCDSAKEAAKSECNKDGERIRNWVDFHVCRNIYARNLDRIREEEYRSASGENLLRRPYYIPTEVDAGNDVNLEECQIARLTEAIEDFNRDSDEMPRSFAKELRNTYPLGEMQVSGLASFLLSRNKKIMGESCNIENMYINEGKTAKWYDALEMMDLYQSIEKGDSNE